MHRVRWWTAMAVAGACWLWPAVTAPAQQVQWRQDYAAARAEARTRDLPLLLDFGTPGCIWCRKLDATTFRDPTVARLLNERFIPLKIDGQKEKKLVELMGVHSYPTLILASPDGHVLGGHEGYLDAVTLSRQLDQIRSAAPAVTPGIVPVNYVVPVERSQAAQALLGRAQEAYRHQQYVLCLEYCRAVEDGFAELPEAGEARRMALALQGNPELGLRIAAGLTERLAEVYLALADARLQAGQPRQAEPYLQRVLQTCPGSRHAETARGLLVRIQAQPVAPQRP